MYRIRLGGSYVARLVGWLVDCEEITCCYGADNGTSFAPNTYIRCTKAQAL